MDHPLAAPDALVRPWRIAAYVGISVAVVELVVLLVIGSGALLRTVSHSVQRAAEQQALAPSASTSAHRPTAARHTAATVAALSPSRVHVLVLNGNGRAGAAAAAAARVRRRGYRISGVGNAPQHIARSMVMYRPGFAGEGRVLARDLGVRIVGPLDGLRRRDLHGAQVVFVLGS